MSLIPCPECNKSVSDMATMCPHCGINLTTNRTPESVVTASDVTTTSEFNTKKFVLYYIPIATVVIYIVIYLMFKSYLSEGLLAAHEASNKYGQDATMEIVTAISNVKPNWFLKLLSFPFVNWGINQAGGVLSFGWTLLQSFCWSAISCLWVVSFLKRK